MFLPKTFWRITMHYPNITTPNGEQMPSFIHYHPQVSELEIYPDEVLDMLRETDRSPENPVVSDTLYLFDKLAELSGICGGYVIFDSIEICRKEGKINIGDLTLSPQVKICGYMKNAEKLAVFICTAGGGFSRAAEKYNKEGEYLKGYITDTFGSLVAEKASDYIQKKLEAELRKQGLLITNRYSPGYCNWQLNDQKQLFRLLPENHCGISLSESCLMQPIKSVSGIIGIGEKVRKSPYACDICNNTTCLYRKVKNKKSA